METSPKQASDWLDDRHLAYHRRQFVEPYRSTVRLGDYVSGILGEQALRPCNALDVGCGAGANILHLSRTLTRASWTGVDVAGSLFEIGRTLIAERGGLSGPLDLVTGDFFQLQQLLPASSFDVAFSIQTVSWLPDYSEFMKEFLSMLKPGGTAFVTSLFTDFRVDARIEITEFEDSGSPREKVFYNIYNRDKFTADCLSMGAREVLWEPFDMDIELPVPSHRRMGTYTRRTDDGKLWQCSGPLMMPWHFAAIRMKEYL